MQNLEQEIRERAYHLWIEGGRPDGNAESHWLAAQREVLAASLSTIARVAEVERPKAKKVRNSRKKRRAA
jgi:hypothetical protein